MAMADRNKKTAIQQKPEESEGMRPVDIWGEYSEERKTLTQNHLGISVPNTFTCH